MGSRRQNGSDAGPESFELRFFLQGLRQKQHGWGAAWGILKRSNQRFCIETMLTQKSSQGYCLEDVAILTHGKVAAENGLHASLPFGSWRWYIWSPASHMFELRSPSQPRGSYNFHQIQANQLGPSATLCQNVASGRLMSGSVQAADDKMTVMLGRNPLNSDSFCGA